MGKNKKSTKWQKDVAKVVRTTVKQAEEPKTHATSNNSVTVNSSGTDSVLPCDIDGGYLQNQRVGNQCYLNYFHYKGHVIENSTSTAGTRIRFILYRTRDNDERISGVTVDDEIDLDHFNILKDFIVTTNPQAKPHATVEITWRGNTKMIYDSATGTSWTNNIYVLYMVSDRSAISAPPSFLYRFRNKFREV